MAPFKEERGGAPVRRILYSLSWQVAGGWINTTVVAETAWIDDAPQQSQAVHPVGQGDGRRSDRRQTSLPWYPEPYGHIQDQAAQAPQKEEEACPDELNQESSGSRPVTNSPSTTSRYSRGLRRSQLTSRRRRPTPQEKSRSSSTPSPTRKRSLRALLTSRAAPTGSDE